MKAIFSLAMLLTSTPAAAMDIGEIYKYEEKTGPFYCLDVKLPLLRVQHGFGFTQVAAFHFAIHGNYAGEAIYNTESGICTIEFERAE